MITRLKTFISSTGLSVRAFALRCGLQQPTLANQLNEERVLSLKTISRVLASYPQLSAEWLMRGTGPMTLDEAEIHESHRVAMLVDTITLLQDAINEKNKTINTLNETINTLKTQIPK